MLEESALGKILSGIALCAAMALSGPAAGAVSAVGQAVQRLRLSPQQLLSLRDLLGGVERGAQVEASGENLFVLRDPGSMAYAGEFSLTVLADGALTVDRVAGAATLDASHSVALPIRLNAKSKAQILAALTGSQILAPDPANPPAAVPALPEVRIAALKFTEANAAGAISQSRAIFFRDGSGAVRTIRVPQTVVLGTSPAAARISDRYFSAIRSDGTHAWRDNVVEVDSDVSLSLAELEMRVCPDSGSCTARKPAAASAFHLIRWQHQLIAAVPPSLLTQLAPVPAPETAAPSGTELPSQTPPASQGTLAPVSPTTAAPDDNAPENPADR
jgi:hypothetical protein